MTQQGWVHEQQLVEIPRATDRASGEPSQHHAPPSEIPRRELVTLFAYLEAGSHKAAAHRLGVSESTARQRISRLMGRVGAQNVAQAAWRLRAVLEAETGGPEVPAPSTPGPASPAHCAGPS